MKQLLFIDDEPRILESISRLLTHRRQEWQMHFASDTTTASQALDSGSFDVFVCDMKFPGRRSGHRMLEELRDDFPDSVRIALSSFAEAEDRHAAYAVAHRFVPKPFDGRVLESVIERSWRLQELSEDHELARMLSRTRHLPSVPSLYLALTEALREPDVSIDELEAIISKDMAMCAKILQMANSAYFGLRRKITSVRHAIVYLGMRMMRQLVFSVEIFRSFPQKLAHLLDPEQIQRHTMLTSRIAADIFPEDRLSDEIFLASMLHDIGKLVLASHTPDTFQPLLEASRERGVPLHEIEHEQGALGHARAGAFLIGKWGLPDAIVEAVAFHHEPWTLGLRRLELPGLIHVADSLAHRRDPDPRFMEELGLQGELEDWRRAAEIRREQFEQEQSD